MVLISVIMPVYNTPVKVLKEAVDSILNQSFRDFEFIIIDDHSTLSESIEYLYSLKDPRVKILRNRENLGITKTLNIGMRASTGKYIARMDSDDISLPNRLERQYMFMETHTDAVLCGSYIECFGDWKAITRYDTRDQELYRIRLLFRNTGPAHPTVMYRAAVMKEHHLVYDERIRFAQDYMMWVNASRVGSVYCIEEVLLRYRVHRDQVSTAKAEEQKKCDTFIIKEQLNCLLENVNSKMAEKHKRYVSSESITEDAYNWFVQLIEANEKKGLYDRDKFRSFIIDLIAKKVCATYNINWKDPRSYRILFKYLPVSYVFGEVKRKAVKKLVKTKTCYNA